VGLGRPQGEPGRHRLDARLEHEASSRPKVRASCGRSRSEPTGSRERIRPCRLAVNRGATKTAFRSELMICVRFYTKKCRILRGFLAGRTHSDTRRIAPASGAGFASAHARLRALPSTLNRKPH